VLVAVTVTLLLVSAAVNRPAEVMVPALADHLTEELLPDAPVVVALHCEVAPGATDAGLQVTAMVELEEDPVCDDPPLDPPQPARKAENVQARRHRRGRCNQTLFILDLALLSTEARTSTASKSG
jgi:hypothetical protein